MIGPPSFVIWILVLVAAGATFYYAAIVGGLFKDTLMEQFRKYGEELRVYPVCRLMNAAGGLCLSLALLTPRLPGLLNRYQRVFPSAVFVLMAFALWGMSLVVYQHPWLGQTLPRWYFELLNNSSRQERRHIAYAWLRIPLAMRWRFNADQRSFRVWTELVRLTVIYGAHDPNSPWAIWT